MFGFSAIPAAVKFTAIAVAVVAVIGLGYKILNDAYERGYAAAEQKAVMLIRKQVEALRADKARLRQMDDAELDAELKRLCGQACVDR